MIVSEKYVSFTTFTRSGKAKSLPVWIADLGDGTCGFTTDLNAWKVKRLSNDHNVTLQPCNIRGVIKEGSEIVHGTAQVVTDDEFKRVLKAINAKYGLLSYLIHFDFRKWFRKGSEKPSTAAIIISMNS